MEPIIIVDGRQLKDLLAAINFQQGLDGGIRQISVHVDGEHAKFKINESMWSPPMGYKREAG